MSGSVISKAPGPGPDRGPSGGLPNLRINAFPLLAGPLGVNTAAADARTPHPRIPAPAGLDALWPDAAGDPAIVSARYDDITRRLQAAVTRLSTEHPTLWSWDAHGSPSRQQPAQYAAPETSSQPRTPPTTTTRAKGRPPGWRACPAAAITQNRRTVQPCASGPHGGESQPGYGRARSSPSS